MKNKIIRFGRWAEKNWLQIIIVLGVLMMVFLCLILTSWLIGYWANALYGMKFELNSCWAGVSAVAAGIVTIVGLAKAAWTKYGYDSRYNTPSGKPPMPPPAADNVNNVINRIGGK